MDAWQKIVLMNPALEHLRALEQVEEACDGSDYSTVDLLDVYFFDVYLYFSDMNLDLSAVCSRRSAFTSAVPMRWLGT